MYMLAVTDTLLYDSVGRDRLGRMIGLAIFVSDAGTTLLVGQRS